MSIIFRSDPTHLALVVIALEERLGKMQWRLDMKDTVRATITRQYAGKGDVTDSD